MMETYQYKDTKGVIWTLSINIGHYLQIKTKLGIDISASFSTEDSWISQIAANDDYALLLGMLDILTAAERNSRELTLDQMYEGIDGDVVAEASTAMIEAIVLFLPAQKKEALRLIVESVNLGMTHAVEMLVEEKEVLLKAIPSQVEQVMKDLKN